MTKWKLCLLLSLYIFLTGAGKVFADFSSVGISSVCAYVSFSQPAVPTIAHVHLTQLTTDYFAVISATVSYATSSTNTVTNIFVNYYLNTQIGFSTVTIVDNPTGVTKPTAPYYFMSKIPVDMTQSPTSFNYRITAKDVYGVQEGYWPLAGTFFTYSIPASGTFQIVHTPISYVSAIDGIVVATGTVTDTVGVNSITMHYKTDDSVDYSSYTLTLSAQSTASKPGMASRVLNAMNKVAPSTYNFAFELDKSRVNFAKAKYFYYYFTATDINSAVCWLPPQGGYFTAQVIAANAVTCGTNGGSISLPNGNPADGSTLIDIPAGALEGNTQVTITEIDPADGSIPPGKSPCASVKPVAVYSFGPENLVFKKFVTMKLLFQDVNHTGVVDGTNYKTSSLKVFWWDGFNWRLLGGKKDQALNLITYGNIKHFSMYALFPANALSDNDYRPKERIITPATIDGHNDSALFTGLVDGDTVNIYDIRGRKIRQLNNGVFSWDGKDDGGQIVESGIYIYQIKLNESGKIISGTVVVAK